MEQNEKPTAENVRTALFEELKTSSLYRLYARQAKGEGYLQIADLLTQTADNELEHAAILWELTHECRVPETAQNLQTALETEQANPYAAFAETAERDGLPETAYLFRQLAEVEKNHARRFRILRENLHTGAVFQKQRECYWICRICGALHKGRFAPQVCAVCGYPQSCFSLYAEDY